MKIYTNYNLKYNNTFGLSAKCTEFISIENIDDIIQSIKLQKFKLPFFILGGGSNILLTHDFQGTIFQSDLKFINIVNENEDKLFIEVGSGIIWDDFVLYCIQKNYGGTENLSGIPGYAGSAGVQNIGAYGVEVKDIIKSVKGINLDNGNFVEFNNQECQYGYRDSIFKHQLKNKIFITSIIFQLQKNPIINLSYKSLKEEFSKRQCSNDIQNIRDCVLEIRNSKLPDPKKTGNAGSFFKNPIIDKEIFNNLMQTYPNLIHYPISEEKVKLAAGQLIDLCGLKGFRMKDAAVHNKQSLVLINLGNATGEDIVNLSLYIQKKVFEIFKIKLEPEVIFL